ncbi:hypothetical protein RHMOL_Rhmol10G0105100 [Rhododendron molle]|uniref:Uncharacterized protein n=1 Tax=Rhododendron molle TaxID=49168 RepID=A0ACC0M243_RHOML|nr:hypothetical protein RHMOL_Rhmol10G0105100 [Rhododendron molle]
MQWSNKKAYKETLLKLASRFKNNFEVFMNDKIGMNDKLTEEILGAGPVFQSAMKRKEDKARSSWKMDGNKI